MTKNVILEVRDIHKDFSKEKVLAGIDLVIHRGERHAIIGPNGAGKTTLFNLLTGLLKPSNGLVFLNAREITGTSPQEVNRKGIGRSFQITNIFGGLSVFENIRAAILSKNAIRFNFFSPVNRLTHITEQTFEILEKIHMTDKKDVLAGELAYGEQRALEIGIALATDPDLILLDEPTAGMSPQETREVVKLIDHVVHGKTLVIIEHDMEVVFTIADVITVIHYGKVLVSGKPEDVREDQRVKDAYLGEH
jgi:branched-chain amino acid transport system ATP-binding protein